MDDLWLFFFFKQKTAYEMRISDWSSDVCSSDLLQDFPGIFPQQRRAIAHASWRTAHLDRNAGDLDRCRRSRLLHIDEHFTDLEMFIREYVGGIVDGDRKSTL